MSIVSGVEVGVGAIGQSVVVHSGFGSATAAVRVEDASAEPADVII